MIKLKPENAYMSVFDELIDKKIELIKNSSGEEFTKNAENNIAAAIYNAVFAVVVSTLDGMRTDIIAEDYPIVRLAPKLCTEKQMADAAIVLRDKLASGQEKIPDTLMRIAADRLELITNAYIEAFSTIRAHKKAICELLFGGREYTCFCHIVADAGDFHNGGKSSIIIETDIGKMVYKPRSLLIDVRMRAFVEKYFKNCVYIPKCYTDGESFGVSEFVAKRVANGREEAERWYYSLGGLSVMVKLLGSKDLHNENIIAADGIPTIIDLETMLSAAEISENDNTFFSALSDSAFRSGIFPTRINGDDLSVLTDAESKNSSMPEVDGQPASIDEYGEYVYEGIRNAYTMCLKRREELKMDIPEFFGDISIRYLFRNSQFYADILSRTYKRKVTADEKSYAIALSKLDKVLSEGYSERYEGVIKAEKIAVIRGDVPLFNVKGSGCDLYADNQIAARNMFAKSPVQNSLDILGRMSGRDMEFCEQLFRRTFEIRAQVNDEECEIPQRSKEPLPREQAILEAERILEKIRYQMITAANGASGWIDLNLDNFTPKILDESMVNGFTGVGLFAAAVMTVTQDEDVKKRANECVNCVLSSLKQKYRELKYCIESEPDFKVEKYIGEAAGLTGILRCAVLTERYLKDGRFTAVVKEIVDLFLQKLNPELITDTDRIGGLAGLIEVLCSYTELSREEHVTELIRSLSNRLVALKSFEADGFKLWKTVSDRHIISGAGHGMMGIAHSLYKAYSLLGNEKWLAAVKEAVSFELDAYSEKLGTWPDRRLWPPQSAMHGFCSGAPGIGILCEDMDIEGVSTIKNLAKKAVKNEPLRFRDHLCCGNCAAVEYCVTTGDFEQAGRILGGMVERKDKLGHYCFTPQKYKEVVSPSLFFGLSGVGYELLRYAFPDRIFSVL